MIREKFALPPSFLRDLDKERRERGWSWNRVAEEAGVKGPSVTRMRRNQGSWATVAAVARCLDVPVPRVVDARSAAGKLDDLKRKNPGAYQMLLRALGLDDDTEGDGDGAAKR